MIASLQRIASDPATYVARLHPTGGFGADYVALGVITVAEFCGVATQHGFLCPEPFRREAGDALLTAYAAIGVTEVQAMRHGRWKHLTLAEWHAAT